MQHVAVRILHPASSPAAGNLECALETARAANAERLAHLFRSVGADDVRIDAGRPDGLSFGERLRALIDGLRGSGGPAADSGPAAGAGYAADTGVAGGASLGGRARFARGGGLVVLGSGSVPLLGRRGAAELVAVAASGERRALANNRYSADVVAIGEVAGLAGLPDLPSDNALPRWLAEQAGYEVDDLRRRWRLALDLDSPLDVLVVGAVAGGVPDRLSGAGAAFRHIDVGVVVDRIDRVRAVASDRRAELVIAGRTSAGTLRWLERSTASRTRALVEERGLRAAGLPAAARPPRSVLGFVLDDRGPQALGSVLAQLGDAAIVDTRVLLAHRFGADELTWPSPEDRFASDLLLADRIDDPWLRALTASARDSTIPVLLGGHTLVGPGVRLLLGGSRPSRPPLARPPLRPSPATRP